MSKKDFYPNWQQASEAAKSTGITSRDSYEVNYQEDKMLPSSPRVVYKDFPGFTVFLDSDRRVYRSGCFYPNWQQASEAAIKMGIRSGEEYMRKYRQDPRLPSRLDIQYSDFPGCKIFFRQKQHPHTKVYYKTWQEVIRACIRLGIDSAEEYTRLYNLDPLLPYKGKLYTESYHGFPGFPISKTVRAIK